MINFNFFDLHLDSINIDYDNVIVNVTDHDEIYYKLVCSNFVSISYMGHWDESVIKSVKVFDELEKSIELQRIRDMVSARNNVSIRGGGTRNFFSEWKYLEITLIDNLQIIIVSEKIELFQEENQI